MVQSKGESIPAGEHVPTADERVVIYNVGWNGFEKLLEVRGDRSPPRVAYLDGAVEIMSPSPDHGFIKSHIGRLVEVYMEHLDVQYTCLGEWLIKQQKDEAGVEPEECYVFGKSWREDRPDLAIEVVWTSGGLNKLEIYRRLGVPEVWFWIRGTISVHVLRETGYELRSTSVCLPGVDLAVVCELLQIRITSDAMKELRRRLAAG